MKEVKTYELDVSNYQAEDNLVSVKEELSQMLRLPGIYENGVETCDGVILAKAIRENTSQWKTISVEDLALLKKVMNILIKRPHNPAMGQVSLGGIRYEELIVRVFTLDKE